MRIHSIQPLLFFALIGTAPAQTVCPSWESVGNTPTALMSVRRLAAADVNQDGLTDIVPIDLFGGPSPVLLNNGTGTFSQGFTFNPGHENFDAAFADFDGDGDPDCIMPMRGVVGGTGFPQGYGFALMSNLGGGSFGPPQYLFLDSIGMAPLGIAVGDMDGDGDPDVAFTAENAPTADYRLGVCLNTGGTLGMPSLVPMTPGIGELCLGDLDGDGDLDALLQTQNGCRVVFGSGQGTFLSGAGSSVYLNNPGSTVTSGVAIGDLNGDGSSDLVVSRRSGLTVWINNGSGAFPTLIDNYVSYSFYPRDVALLDYDMDGDLDPVICEYTAIRVFRNDNLTFNTSLINWATDPNALLAVDTNGGGGLEIVATNGSTGGIELYEGESVCASLFCQSANLNSTGSSTHLWATRNGAPGSGVHLEAFSGPAGELGYVLLGTSAQAPGSPVGGGILCLAGTLGRYNVIGGALNSIGQFDGTGVLQNLVGTSQTGSGFDVPMALPLAGSPTLTTGQTLYFQLWHRDTPMAPGASNLSNGLAVTF